MLNEARAKGEIIKCIILRDVTATKCAFAHVVPMKGDAEEEGRFASDLVAEDVLWLGHTKLIVKADNEPALQALVVASLRRIRILCNDEPDGGLEVLSKEEPEPYESQSNGGIEVGVKLLKGQFRSLRLCLESRLGKRIPINHPIIAWLVSHSAVMMDALYRGTDGLAPWTRARGRPFNMRLVGFAEKVMYKLPPKGPQHDPHGNVSERWLSGIFLGYKRSSNSYVIGVDEGIATSRAVQRRPLENRWELEAISQLKATP
jgi:hypothetical protein